MFELPYFEEQYTLKLQGRTFNATVGIDGNFRDYSQDPADARPVAFVTVEEVNPDVPLPSFCATRANLSPSIDIATGEVTGWSAIDAFGPFKVGVPVPSGATPRLAARAFAYNLAVHIIGL